MSLNKDGKIILEHCATCKRPVFHIWDKEGNCVTCSRNKTLGEDVKPPQTSYSNLPKGVKKP
jgi:uncharacterized Zn finger protein (UPF0148 family)